MTHNNVLSQLDVMSFFSIWLSLDFEIILWIGTCMKKVESQINKSINAANMCAMLGFKNNIYAVINSSASIRGRTTIEIF